MSSERRKYFRIEDSIMLKYRVVAVEAQESAQNDAELNRMRIETARAALFGIETDFQEMCEPLAREHPSIVDVLQILNRKINLLERVISSEMLHASPAASDLLNHEAQSVNLSGGGMSLRATDALPENARLIIDMVLLPSHDPIRVFGQVVHCQPSEDEQFEIGIEFVEVNSQDRERIIRHTLQRQAEQIRKDRIAEEVSEA